MPQSVGGQLAYADLGPSHFDRLNTERLTRHYLRRLEDLGLQVDGSTSPGGGMS